MKGLNKPGTNNNNKNRDLYFRGHIAGKAKTDVTEEYIASIFMVEVEVKKQTSIKQAVTRASFLLE